MSKYSIEESDLRHLHSDGLGNREIARKLQVPHWYIAKQLKKYGLVTNVLRGSPPTPVDATHSLCNKCNRVIENTAFPYVQGRADGRRLSYCRDCRYKQTRQAMGSNPVSYFRDKTSRVRRNRRNLPCDLSDGYLLERWYIQEGKCFYTDQDLVLTLTSGKGPLTPSIDRVDTTRGYLEGNVVICSDRVNAIKRDVTLEEMYEWMPGWYERAAEYLYLAGAF